MVSRIWSCSTAPTPMLSRASRVPQSGQISVVPSVLDKAGGAAYLSPHRGHIRIRNISLFMSCHLHRFYLCFGKVVLIKSEADIPLKACAYIGKGRYSYLPFFMHDIHLSLIHISSSFFIQFQNFRFIVYLSFRCFPVLERSAAPYPSLQKLPHPQVWSLHRLSDTGFPLPHLGSGSCFPSHGCHWQKTIRSAFRLHSRSSSTGNPHGADRPHSA